MNRSAWVLSVLLVLGVSSVQAAGDAVTGELEVPTGTLIPLPDQASMTRHVLGTTGELIRVESIEGGWAAFRAQADGGEGGVAGTDEDVVFSNTNSDFLVAFGAGTRIGDDLYTKPGCDCQLSGFEFVVSGGGDGTGPGFSVDYALHDGCPNAAGEVVPGTQGTVELPDDGMHLVSVDLTGLEIAKQASFWLALTPDANGVGWLMGAPAEIGYSADRYDYPTFPCNARFAGSPIFSSFYSRLICEPSILAEAVNPIPADQATGVEVSTTLQWNAETVASAGGVPADWDSSWEAQLVPGQTCATFERFKANHPDHDGGVAGGCGLEGECDNPTTRDFLIPGPTTTPKSFRLSFRVFCEDAGGNCAASQADIDGAVAQLRADFAPWAFEFVYETEFINSTEYRFFAADEEAAMKMTFADSPGSKLNVYVVSTTGYSVGTFPWDGVALQPMGGIILHQGHVFQGSHILTHEVGHNVGLWHTHHGVSEVPQCSGCYERRDGQNGDTTGDYCSDTPATPVNFNCGSPGGSDPCSETPWGETATENYMSYAPSSCQDSFSPQQAGRFHCWSQEVLTSWMDEGACVTYYDVYLSTANPPLTPACQETDAAQCTLPELAEDTTYYWRVVSKRGEAIVPGPVWSFHTAGGCDVVSSNPPHCAIDARQPHAIDNPSEVQGWTSVDIVLSCDPGSLATTDFSVSTESAPAPDVADVSLNGSVATVTLSEAIPVGEWICITYDGSGESVCLAHLPADVNGDGVAAPNDILAIIDSLNGVTPLPDYSTDVDRSGLSGPSDILRVIDLLNGAATFEPWLDAVVGPCPSGMP